MIYNSAGVYVESAASIQEKIVRIDQVISALTILLIDNSSAALYKEYQLDDGQTKIRSVYNTPVDIGNSIRNMEQLKQMYINKLNGRTFRLVDGRNFL